MTLPDHLFRLNPPFDNATVQREEIKPLKSKHRGTRKCQICGIVFKLKAQNTPTCSQCAGDVIGDVNEMLSPEPLEIGEI